MMTGLWIALAAVSLFGLTVFLLPYAVAFVVRRLPPVFFLRKSSTGADRKLRHQVISTFLGGLAEGCKANPASFDRVNDRSKFEQPFWIEGMFTGLHLARTIAPWRGDNALKLFLERNREQYAFLLLLGSGFARGMETIWKGQPQADMTTIEPRLTPLCHDGFGFQQMIFSYMWRPGVLLKGLSMPRVWQAGYYEGVGRSLWFLTENVGLFLKAIEPLSPELQRECRIGYGIAAAFAGGRQLSRTNWISSEPGKEDGEIVYFRLGLTIGLFARYHVNADFTREFLLRQNAKDLLLWIEQVRSLYDQMWLTGHGYQEWRSVLEGEVRLRSGGAEFACCEGMRLPEAALT